MMPQKVSGANGMVREPGMYKGGRRYRAFRVSVDERQRNGKEIEIDGRSGPCIVLAKDGKLTPEGIARGINL